MTLALKDVNLDVDSPWEVMRGGDGQTMQLSLKVTSMPEAYTWESSSADLEGTASGQAPLQFAFHVREDEFVANHHLVQEADLPQGEHMGVLVATLRALSFIEDKASEARDAVLDCNSDGQAVLAIASDTDVASEDMKGLQQAVADSASADYRMWMRRLSGVRSARCHVVEDARRMLAAIDEHATRSNVHAYLVRRPWNAMQEDAGIVGLAPDAPCFDRRCPTVWLGAGDAPAWMHSAMPSPDASRAARRYWTLECYRSRAGRSVHFLPSLQHVAYALRLLARRGVGQVFLKAARLKAGTWTVDIPASARTLEGAWEALSDAVGPHFMRMPDCGQEKGFLVQDVLDMRNETRFFVVGGRIVGGVPVHRAAVSGQRYEGDGRSRRIRGVASPTPDCPDVAADRVGAARRAWMAHGFVRAARVEKPRMDCYVVDVADTQRGPVVIEVNPLPNAGLYAMDPSLLARALAAASQARRLDVSTNRLKMARIVVVDRLSDAVKDLEQAACGMDATACLPPIK